MKAEVHKLAHIGITFKIGRSTLADANRRRPEAVFEAIYRDLYARYRQRARDVYRNSVRSLMLTRMHSYQLLIEYDSPYNFMYDNQNRLVRAEASSGWDMTVKRVISPSTLRMTTYVIMGKCTIRVQLHLPTHFCNNRKVVGRIGF